MRPAARRRRAILRDRRRLGWDTGNHPNLCECVDCTAAYGAVHAPLCRCPECVDYGVSPTNLPGVSALWERHRNLVWYRIVGDPGPAMVMFSIKSHDTEGS